MTEDAERAAKLVELRGYYDDWQAAKRALDDADWSIDQLEIELFGKPART